MMHFATMADSDDHEVHSVQSSSCSLGKTLICIDLAIFYKNQDAVNCNGRVTSK